MKKWLDDLYAILMKRGFITLDNVLKNDKIIEDNKYVEVNDVVISSNENITIDFSELAIGSFFTITLVSDSSSRFYTTFYKSTNNQISVLFQNVSGFERVDLTNKTVTYKNTSSEVITGKVIFKNTI